MHDYRSRTAAAARRVVVTGGGGEIGAAIAASFAAEGARVVIVGRSESVDNRARELRCMAVRADLADPVQLEDGFHDAIRLAGGLDVLVNCHGVGAACDPLVCSSAEWEAVLRVNLGAVFQLCQLAASQMIPQGSGKIVNVSSILGFVGGRGSASYAVSKAGVAHLTRVLANEWAASGINVNAVVPGYISTRMNLATREDPDSRRVALERIPAGRFGEPDDVVGAVHFLASGGAAYVHGALLPVDGGWLVA